MQADPEWYPVISNSTEEDHWV